MKSLTASEWCVATWGRATAVASPHRNAGPLPSACCPNKGTRPSGRCPGAGRGGRGGAGRLHAGPEPRCSRRTPHAALPRTMGPRETQRPPAVGGSSRRHPQSGARFFRDEETEAQGSGLAEPATRLATQHGPEGGPAGQGMPAENCAGPRPEGRAGGPLAASPSWPPPTPRGCQAHRLPQGARHVVPSSQAAGRSHSTVSPPTIKNHITRGAEPAAFHQGKCPVSRSPRLSPRLRPGDAAATPHTGQAARRGSLGGAHVSHGLAARAS